MRLNSMSASYPEGNFGGNQLLDGSISLTPLDPDLTIDLHVRTATDLHQSFLWLVLSGHSSPSFGSQRVRSNSATSTSGTRRVSGAPRPRGNGDPECGRPPPACTFISPPGLFKTH
ncbi:hypothetical protein JTE90_005430 [Oedothorax gibbosus]|uniref:Uncharacterized protein n=1 Tax=Oedothorax gibbosus TaxID=931172 RepID=A0AAV6TF32_9ARAC|nr:hypothetical protein JTE90_005430 [Oedothorax gibbosus]